MYPDERLKYHKSWDKKLLSAFKEVSINPQPLKELINEELWALILRIEKGEEAMESIVTNYYKKTNN